MKVQIKKLHNDAVIPKYSRPGDAGMDITALGILKQSKEQVTYGTGIAVEIPEGHVGLIFPRSSIRNYELMLSNSVGVIDSGYRGEIQVTFNTRFWGDIVYKKGDKIAQMIIMPYPQIELEEVEKLSDSDRGEEGFGSTGK